VKKRSGSGVDALESWAKIYGTEGAASDLFSLERGDGVHSTLPSDPAGDGGLINTQGLAGLDLRPEVLDELFVDIHAEPFYDSRHILDYGENPLQAYGKNPDHLGMNSIGQRVKAARTYAGLTQVQLAEKAKMDQTTISKLEKGHNAKSAFCVRIAVACGVSPVWIETGQGDMLPKESSSPTDNGGNVEPLHVHEASVVALSDFKRVPLISWVAAGTWSEAIDLYEVGDAEVWMPCPDPIGPRGFALRVEGDSMTSPYPGSESYPHGTFIYVDPDIAHKSGDPVIAKLPASNSATFKIFFEDAGQQYLKPLNPQHPMIPITEETHIVAVLVGSYRKR
jgi:SOS-response transcriptional repressor LexA